MEIAVIGAGASGLMAALTAAEDKNNTVRLFERQQRVGKKLSVTGNGRCNLTNTNAAVKNYHGSQPAFVKPAFAAFPPAEVTGFFNNLGLLTVEEYGGRVYPLSDSANSVVDVLRFALDEAGVIQQLSSCVRSVSKNAKGFVIATDEGSFRADRLIIACGGAAGVKAGGVSDGYELLASLGHTRTKLFPALVQLTCDSEYPRSLKGVRADARLSLLKAGKEIVSSCGELQFTEKGISGPATFDISREAACAIDKGLCVRINFFREYSEQQILEMLKKRCRSMSAMPCEEMLTGMLHNRLGKMMLRASGIEKTETVGQLSYNALAKVAATCCAFTMKIKGCEGFDSAQVTAGGMQLGQFNSETLESRLVPGLYACGEVLDIDGDCGGYNLQWAWASGRLAGRLLK